MNLYIYNTETLEVVAVVSGDSNDDCEALAAAHNYDSEEYGWTYSPAFGCSDGLIETTDTDYIEQ